MSPKNFVQPQVVLSTSDTQYPVTLFNIESLIEGDIEEIEGNVIGTGYRWVWLFSDTSVSKAHTKAVRQISAQIRYRNCNAAIGVTTNVTYFPGILGLRGCSVLLTGTAVKISDQK